MITTKEFKKYFDFFLFGVGKDKVLHTTLCEPCIEVSLQIIDSGCYV